MSDPQNKRLSDALAFLNPITQRLQNAWQQLSPFALSIWIFYYLAFVIAFGLTSTVIGSLVALIPWAGFLIVLLKVKQERKNPDFNDLIGQFDHFLPLLNFALLYFVTLVVYLIVATLVKRIPLLGFFSFLFLTLIFFSLLTLVSTYSVLLICHQRDSALDGVVKAINLLKSDFANQFLLGLSVVILSIPCGLGAPLGFYVLIEEYLQKFPKRN